MQPHSKQSILENLLRIKTAKEQQGSTSAPSKTTKVEHVATTTTTTPVTASSTTSSTVVGTTGTTVTPGPVIASAVPTVTTGPIQMTITQQPTHNSSGANVYANTVGLSPLGTVQLLLVAMVLGVMGLVLVEGSILANLYAWLARIVGVKAPLSQVSHV
jgi:hypothetical protein